jgi:L-ascorbate metabolism protein UlaG (beta-lactamase superfamily)
MQNEGESGDPITRKRHRLAIGVVGGATTVIDYGLVRLVTDPTFDPPGPFGPYRKTAGPAVTPADIGPVDAVLLSHDLHLDNFDVSGRQFAAAAPLVVTGPRGAARLGGNARGLTPFESTLIRSQVPGSAAVTVYTVPAQHGPLDGERDEYDDINTEVVGFILRAPDLPTVYVSGDNASILPVVDIAARFDDIDIGVLNVGAARVASKNAGRPLTLTADRATDVAQVLGLSVVVPAHSEGWSLYSQGIDEIRKSFADAGISDRLQYQAPGTWTVR